jgi:predicted  nucleic acid-binding Zn-ribbon protein
MTKSECQPADEVERLRERVLAYKGQVEAGAAEIAALKARVAELEAALQKDNTHELLKHWQRAADKLQNDLRTSSGFDTRESRMVDKALANVRQKTTLALSTNPGEQE